MIGLYCKQSKTVAGLTSFCASRYHIPSSDESLANEVSRVSWYPVTPFPGVLRVAGAEDAEEQIVVASVGGGVAAPPCVQPGHLGLGGRVDKHSLRLSVSG